MRERRPVIHDAAPGEDGSAADATPGQSAAGHGDGEYDLPAEDCVWIKQRDILGLLLRHAHRQRLPGQAPVIAVTRVLPNLTARAEPSVDTASSGSQASRTSPPAALAAEQTGPSLARHTKNRGVSRSGRRRDGKGMRRRAETEYVRVFVCHACNTADSVPWCGQLYCGHSACMDELEKRAAKHRLTSERFHGPVKLLVVGKNLWENHPHYAVTADAC